MIAKEWMQILHYTHSYHFSVFFSDNKGLTAFYSFYFLEDLAAGEGKDWNLT